MEQQELNTWAQEQEKARRRREQIENAERVGRFVGYTIRKTVKYTLIAGVTYLVVDRVLNGKKQQPETETEEQS